MAVRVGFEIGHEASIRTKKTVEGFTHDWEVFVRGSDGTQLPYFVEKVVFYLHETFPNPRRVIKQPPYVVKESGYAGFLLPIEIHVKHDPKKVKFNYDLTLQTSGPAVRNVQKEQYVFKNPTEELKNCLVKGGGIMVNSNSLHDGLDSRTSSDLKNELVNKPKLALSSESLLKKQHRSRIEEHQRPSNSFQDLFGTPITKTNKQFSDPSQKSSATNPTKESSSSQRNSTTPNPKGPVPIPSDRTRDKSKLSPSGAKEKDSERRRKDREERRAKEKSRDRAHSKEKSSSKRPPSPPPLSSVRYKEKEEKRSSKERERKEEKMEKMEKMEKIEKKSKKEKRDKEHKENRRELERSGKNAEHKEPRVKEKNNKESLKEGENLRKTEKKVSPDRAERKSEKSEEKKEKHKHKKKDKEKKEKDRDKKRERSKEKEKQQQQQQQQQPVIIKKEIVETKPEIKEEIKENSSSSLFGSAKSDQSKKHSLFSEDLSNSSLSSGKEDSSFVEPPPSSIPEPIKKESLFEPSAKKTKNGDGEKIKKEKSKKSKDKKAEKEEKKRKRKAAEREPPEEPPPEKEVKTEQPSGKPEKESGRSDSERSPSRGDAAAAVAAAAAANDKENNHENPEEYMEVLKDLQTKIVNLRDNSELQRVVQLIAQTGRYEVSQNTFDFDLCLLEKSTVKQLQEFFASS